MRTFKTTVCRGERFDAFGAQLAWQPELTTQIGDPQLRALANLGQVLQEQLLSGDHDGLLDESRLAEWPSLLEQLAVATTEQLTGDNPALTSVDELAAEVRWNLGLRFLFFPAHFRQDGYEMLCAYLAVCNELAERGWVRRWVSPSYRGAATVMGVGNRSIVDVRFVRQRMHVEVQTLGTATSQLFVLGTASRDLVAVEGPPHPDSGIDAEAFSILGRAVTALRQLLRLRDTDAYQRYMSEAK